MGKTALVIIDIQNGFMTEDTKHLSKMIARLPKLIPFDEIIATQYFNFQDSFFVQLLDWDGMMTKAETQLTPEIKALKPKTFEKETYTAFTKEFIQYLMKEDIETLVFVGVDTECCVLKSAVDAFENGYKPYVLSDYCASSAGNEIHLMGIEVIKRLIGERQTISSTDTKKILEGIKELTIK